MIEEIEAVNIVQEENEDVELEGREEEKAKKGKSIILVLYT